MNILLVVPHITLFRPEGHMHRLRGTLSLLKDHTLSLLAPTGSSVEIVSDFFQSISYFKEPALGKRPIPYFLHRSSSFKKNLAATLAEQSIELVIFDFPWGLSALEARPEIPCVYFSHGVEKDFSAITAKHLGLDYAPVRLLAEKIIAAIEQRACERADCIVTISAGDSQAFVKEYGVAAEKLCYLPQVVERYQPERTLQAIRAEFNLPPAAPVLVFHGSESHYPNRQALQVLKQQIAPEFSGQDVWFVIAGTGQSEYRDGNIISLGFVENIHELLSACTLAIVPVFDTCGAQMKVLDYFSAGVPCIVSKGVAAGFSLQDGHAAQVVEHRAESFVKAIAALLADSKKQAALRKGGFEFIETTCSPRQVATGLNERLQELRSS